jgi:deoxyribose-phosphate aldolase
MDSIVYFLAGVSLTWWIAKQRAVKKKDELELNIDHLNSFPVNTYIDHTVLKQTCTLKDIEKLCREAITYKFVAVCVPPYWASTAKQLLSGTIVKVAIVIGFPLGYSVITAKGAEIEQAIIDNVDEIDIVANVSAIKNGDWNYLKQEIDTLMTIAKKKSNLTIKVIIESGMLTDDEIIKCCSIYSAAGIDYLKTSTGFAEKGASIQAVQLFRRHLPTTIAIKASGGIRTKTDALKMIAAGATRIGCSAGVSIMNEMDAGPGGY